VVSGQEDLRTGIPFEEETMQHNWADDEGPFESLLAQLTDTAYRVAVRHGIKGSFLDLELGLWQALREVLEREVPAREELEYCLSEGSACQA
jgi:hypothetical protein